MLRIIIKLKFEYCWKHTYSYNLTLSDFNLLIKLSIIVFYELYKNISFLVRYCKKTLNEHGFLINSFIKI